MRRILPLICLALPVFGVAQSFFGIRNERNLRITAGTGTATYFGELSNPGTMINLQPNLNVGLMYSLAPRIAVRTELNWFVLHGDDKSASDVGRKLRDLSFRSNCFEISAIGEVSLFANGSRYYRRPTINVYGFGGVGLLYFNPVADYNGKSYSLAPLKTEGVSYSRITPVIPVGLGARLKITPNIDLAVEGGFRKTFTDYLDDVSSKYTAPDPSDPVRAYFQNPNNPAYNPAATGDTNTFNAGSKRGNSSSMDSYFLLNAKIEYYLPMSTRPGIRKNKGVFKRKSNYRYNKAGRIRR